MYSRVGPGLAQRPLHRPAGGLPAGQRAVLGAAGGGGRGMAAKRAKGPEGRWVAGGHLTTDDSLAGLSPEALQRVLVDLLHPGETVTRRGPRLPLPALVLPSAPGGDQLATSANV